MGQQGNSDVRDNEPMGGGIAYIPDPLRSPDRRAGIGPALARAAKAAWPMHILPSPLPPTCTPARGDQRGRAVSRRPLPNVPSNSEWMLLSVFHWVRAGSAMSALASAAEGLTGSPETNCYTRPVRAWRVRSRTDKPGTRWKSVSIVTSVKLRSSAVAAIKVSISPIRPGPWGGRNARRRSA